MRSKKKPLRRSFPNGKEKGFADRTRRSDHRGAIDDALFPAMDVVRSEGAESGARPASMDAGPFAQRCFTKHVSSKGF